jgi:hypothetical protein
LAREFPESGLGEGRSEYEEEPRGKERKAWSGSGKEKGESREIRRIRKGRSEIKEEGGE